MVMNMKTKSKTGYPVIGVTANIDDNKVESQNINSNYVDAIYHTHSIPLILPMPDITLHDSCAALAERVISGLDGLLLTGGDHVSALFYGEENLAINGSFTEERDIFEIELCRAAAAQKKPILGICRGIQLLNAVMGGTLFQDIIKQNPEKSMLLHMQKSPSYSGVHDVELLQHSQIEGLLLETSGNRTNSSDAPARIRVNSFHQQAVKDVAPGFMASANTSDGIIEAIEPRNRNEYPFTIGVQWHPERMWRHHKHSERLFAAFAEACRN
jgi:putative glutamine amidotransferase